MEETIHINIELRKTESGHVSISTTRLWPSILRFTLSTMYSPIKGTLVHGTCLTILNNLAIVVEGFITDLITQELSQKEHSIKLNSDRSVWSQKKDVYEKLFIPSLEEYKEFPAIEILFLLRNNISHGRSHSELCNKNDESNDWDYIESENKNYETIRTYLINNGLFKRKTIPSNVDVFWTPQIAAFFCSKVKSFLFAVIKKMDDKQSMGISGELNTACQY